MRRAQSMPQARQADTRHPPIKGPMAGSCDAILEDFAEFLRMTCELSEKCELCEMCELCDERDEDPGNEGRALLYLAEPEPCGRADRLTNARRLSIIGETPCPVCMKY
jgi:hypothetical protein